MVSNQPGGGSVDKTSSMLDFNEHNMDDLLPYAFCCRSSSMPSCGEYERLRPSMLESAQAYELPVPGKAFYSLTKTSPICELHTYVKVFCTWSTMECMHFPTRNVPNHQKGASALERKTEHTMHWHKLTLPSPHTPTLASSHPDNVSTHPQHTC
jgi:hypothetical protein